MAADGPRSSRPDDAAKCQATRAIAAQVDWPCEVHQLFREHNLGCKRAVSGAIDWFFAQEQAGIVLEDDCVPDPTFFDFCDEMLDRYRDDERVGLICGANFQFGRKHGDASYYFSRYAHVWGWAAWRRTWQRYSKDIPDWPSFRRQGGLKRVFGSEHAQQRFWRHQLDAVHAGKIDTWDYQLNYALWRQGMLSIVPQHNLIRNIGFGAEATHTTGAGPLADMAVTPIEFPLRHPASVERCVAADNHVGEQLFSLTIAAQAIGLLRSVLKRLKVKAS